MANYGLKAVDLCVVLALGWASAAFGVSEQRKPDYADPSGRDWLYNHAIPEKHEAQEPTEDPGVDLFYLLPTTGPSSSGAVDYICSIDDTSMRSTARSWWGATGAVFGGFTHVYAPFYRQVLLSKLSALYSQYTWWEANALYSKYIYDHAGFEDACAALDHYFTCYNPGAHRPFILAGASQGSALIYELLEHYFTLDDTHKAYLKNLVAVYSLGYGLDHARMARIKSSTSLPGFEGVRPATNAVDSGVLISWNTVGLGNINNVLLPKDAAVVINPLSWTTNGVLAEKELNLGAYNFSSKTSTPGLYDAQVDTQRGTVICRTMPDSMRSGYGAFGPNSFHERDTMAYWVNIQTNALTRIRTHLQKTSGEGDYVCGYRDGTMGFMPTSTDGSSEYVTTDNGMFYVYLGRAEIRDDGVIDFSRLTYITNAVPKQGGYGAFGNYDTSLAKNQVWQNDRIDPKGGQDYTILLVSVANGSTSPPALPAMLHDYQTNMYVAVYTGTSAKKLTTDLWQYAEITVDKPIVVADYNNGTLGKASPIAPIVFYDHMEYPPESKYATINIPKSYLVERHPGMTDDELKAASIAPRTEGNKCTTLESYVLGLDPDDAQSIPVVMPGLTASENKLQINVGNVTVNPDANADVKYGLVSSASPDFSDPTVEVEPQSSPALEGALPTTGVKYYRANLTIQGK